jgi:uncharacterized protein (DUF362 family)
MSKNIITRREFLKTISISPFLVSLPMNQGCFLQQPVEVSLVKDTNDSYAIKRALELIGGLDFLNIGDSVLLKLALNSSNPFPATTSPSMISELIALLKDRGAGDILVGDRSAYGRDTMYCMEETGIYQAAIDSGAEVVVFEDNDTVHVKPAGAVHWPEGFSVPRLFNQVDHIIALPRLSTHAMAGFTMGLKIFVGAIPPDERLQMHTSHGLSSSFLKCLAEIALCSDKIRLSILDARQGFSKGGPDEGTLVTPGIIIASKSLVGADAVGLALLKTIGTTSQLMNMRVWDHPTIARGIEVFAPYLTLATIDLLSEGIDNMDAINEQLQ